MAFAHQPLRDKAPTLGPRAVARMIALCGVALLSACAGFTQHVSNPGEASARSAARAPGEADAAAIQARYTTYSPAGSPYYDDRKASRAARPISRSGMSTTLHGLTRTSTAKAPQAQVAHVAPTLTGAISDTSAAPDSGQTLSRDSQSSTMLDVASIAFNVPTSMTLERRTLIQLALAATGEASAEGIAPTATDAAQPIGRYIEAQLSGGDFDIEPVTAGRQALHTARTTEWLWLVTPKKPGTQHLQLKVTALADTGDVPVRRGLPTFEHTVLVSTRWQDDLFARVDMYAAWLWAALLAAPLLLLWAYARWRRKHRRWFRSSM